MAEYYFSLPPIDQLTPSQQAAVTDLLPIALSGGPGTGKSVVALWRHIVNHTKSNPTHSQLLTYTTSLAHYLKACVETQNEAAAQYVESALYWKQWFPGSRDEFIIDEAQDLPIAFHRSLKTYSERISYGADDQQIITAHYLNPDRSYNLEKCSPERILEQEFPDNSPHRLNKNFRCTQCIMRFARGAFPKAFIPDEIIRGLNNRPGDLPRLIVSNGNTENENKAILDLIRQFSDDLTNIAILVPFAKPPGPVEKYAVPYYYRLISEAGIDCSVYESSMGRLHSIKNVHITTFKSAKGLEFDVVILPNFDLLYQSYRVVDWRDFYVGVTRAKSNLYLITGRSVNMSAGLFEKVDI
jgi:superfamily I DNA/RNA helicase